MLERWADISQRLRRYSQRDQSHFRRYSQRDQSTPSALELIDELLKILCEALGAFPV
jgi:hypothetical protein